MTAVQCKDADVAVDVEPLNALILYHTSCDGLAVVKAINWLSSYGLVNPKNFRAEYFFTILAELY